jgi:hypothetical protein
MIGTLTELPAQAGHSGQFLSTNGSAPSWAATGGGNVFTGSANTFTTGTQTIQTGAAGTVGLAVRATAGQTANLQEWRDSAGAVLASLSANGRTLTMPVQFAIGNGSVASGSQSLAAGLSASAGGGNAVAIGALANASQTDAIAIGTNAAATAGGAVALGGGATANQVRAFALGAGVALAPDELVYGSVAGFGATAHLRLTGHSDVQPRSLFRLTTAWVSSTDASFKTRFSLHTCDAGAPSLGREVLRGEASGAAPLIGFLGAAAVARQAVPATATDAATTQALANSLRQALVNLGLCQ